MQQMPQSVHRSELFTGISRAEIEQMICRARFLEFASGEMIHVIDDPITQVVLLAQGLIKTCQSTEKGQEVILRFCVSGEIISERALVFGRVHSSTALAVAPCKALAWEFSDFNAMAESFPDVRKNAERILKARLAEFSQRLLEVSTKATSPRLAIGLIRLANCIGDHIEMRVSQETVAQMTGMTLSSVSRLLAIWRAHGIVKLRRETIEIHGFLQLLSCAGLPKRCGHVVEPADGDYRDETAVVDAEPGVPVAAGLSRSEA